MRTARLLGLGRSYYHCVSRVVDRRFVLGDFEKEHFRKTMRKLEVFTGVEVLTYTVLSNHWHLLLEVPERIELSEEEVLRRYGVLNGARAKRDLEGVWEMWREQGHENLVQRDLQRLQARMYDLSVFIKELKQRFTQWYNRNQRRKGTLWEERFKSVLVEGSAHALITMAAYIDLNAVRAGICKDPKDYRYCGYAEAVGGGKTARDGLSRILEGEGQKTDWRDVSRNYRVHLYGVGQHRTKPGGKREEMVPVITPERAKQVIEEGGALSRRELLHCRVRYMADGMVLGSKDFVNEVFMANKKRFGYKRQDGARKLKHGDWGELYAMRDLRLSVIEAPTRT